jgi:hypothetical protein
MLEERRFTAYKQYIHDQSRTGHVRGLTFAEARDENRFPLGPQFEADGRKYIWTYGINNGEKI